MRFSKSAESREQLLRMFLKQRDVWAPGNEAGVIEYSEALNKK
jgi:hypothetical protein